MISRAFSLLALGILLQCSFVVHGQKAENYWMYLATSDTKDSIGGMSIYQWNAQNCVLTFYKKSKAPKQARYLEINTSKRKLFSVANGIISTYVILDDGTLQFANEFFYGKEKGGFIALDKNQEFLLC